MDLFRGVLATPFLCHVPHECGQSHAACGALKNTIPLVRGVKADVCVGFQAGDFGSDGHKALFSVEVDRYASLSVDSLRAIMGQPWSAAKASYRRMWVGTQGRRTIGQQRGWLEVGAEDKNCSGLPAPNRVSNVGGSVVTVADEGLACFGWTLHNKLTALQSGHMSQGLTAIIHLKMGNVNRIVWDSSCKLCPTGQSALVCFPDGTNVTCTSGGEDGSTDTCQDCYAQVLGSAS